MSAEFPFEIKNVTDEEDKTIKKYYKRYLRAFVRVGPRGYLLPPRYADHAAALRALSVRPTDVWVVSFSRSGTTWLQELTWLVANDLDFAGAARVPLTQRYAFIEYPTLGGEGDAPLPPRPAGAPSATRHDWSTLDALAPPRFVKTHLPLSLLPPALLSSGARVLYIARDVRDVAVSFFFMHKLFRYFDHDVQFDEFWELFKKDLLLHMPIFPHIEEAWLQRDHPNMLFLFYEEMQNDMSGVIDKVCSLFGKQYSREQRAALAQHVSFDNMKRGHQIARAGGEEGDSEIAFMRKGKSGGWVEYFGPRARTDAERYVQAHAHLAYRHPPAPAPARRHHDHDRD